VNIKKLFSGLIASTLLISSVPSSLVFANSDQDDPKEKEVSSNQAITTDGMDEIEGARTAFTKTFKDNQGKLYKEIYAEPVHAKTKDTFEEIDNTVSTDPSDKDILATENTSLAAEFPKNLQHDTGFTFKKGPHQVEFELTGAFKQGQKINPNLLSKTSLENNKVQYNDVYPDVDLRHITFNEEVKEDWIIKKYTGINQFSYTLRTKLKPVLQQDGSIDFLEKTGDAEAVFTLPAPEMMDSNINEGKGEGTYSKQLRYLLEENTNGTYNLVLDIDKEWLASSDRKYPIYVDPSVSIDALGDAYISSKAPTTNFNEKWDPVQGEYVLQTGYYDSTSGTNYAFIKFSVANELKGAVIDSASLQAYVTHAYYATQKNGLWVDEANSKWAINEVNWNNKPSSTKISSTLVGRDEWAKLDVKSTLQAWVSEERPNTGFKLHTNGNGQTYWKKITASESANKPKLVISYHYDQMPTPTMSAQLDNATAKTGSINVNWKSVFGAKSYKLQMFDGYRYEMVYTGSGLNWTSKDKKIFPKAPFSSSSRYKLDGTGTELPVDPSAFYSANLGSATTAKAYKFRVIPVYPTGDGPSSTIISKEIPVPAGEPDLPTVTTGTYSEADTINKGRGWLNVKWNKVANATGYKVRIWNGSVYKNYTVGKDTTSISTKGKKIWPTDDQIKAGVTDLYDVNFDDTASTAKGAELPIDPSATYGSSSSRYSVRVIATSAAGDSPSSDVNYGYMKLYAPKNVSITANDDNLVQNKTSLTMKWSPSIGANYYEVQLNNGTSIEKYKVKGTTSFTTPKTAYELGKTYTANVVAFFDDDDTAYESEEDKVTGQRGLSDKSSTSTLQPALRDELLGLEEYFTYDEDSFGNANSYVNVTSGNQILQFTDETLYTRNLEYAFNRSYNSRSTKVSALGKGWTFMGNESLKELSNGDVSYEDEDGTVHLFKKNSTGGYLSPKGLYENLKNTDNTFVMTDKDKFVQTFKFDSKKNTYLIASYTDAFKNQIDFKRNDLGQVIEVSEANRDASQEKIVISYSGDFISKVQYGDHWTTFVYSGNNLVKTIVGSQKTTRTITEMFEFDTNGFMKKYIDGKGNETAFNVDGNKLTIFDKQSANAELSVTKTYDFNSNQNEYTVLDSNDNEQIYKRDAANNSYAVSEILEPEDGGTSTFKYDDQLNMIEFKDSSGESEINEFDSNGNLLSSKSNEGVTTYTYNSSNQLLSSMNSVGEKTTNTYEGPLLMSSQTKDEVTSYLYDSYGRVIKTTYPNNTFEKYDYFDDERRLVLTDKKGNVTSETYSIYDQKIKEVDSDNHSITYSYDPIHLTTISTVTDGNGNTTKYEYDDNKNLTSLTDGLGRTKSYIYNENDQVTKASMPTMTFEYQYDQNGELSQSKLPSGITRNYTYDNNNLLSQHENGDENISYKYDENENLTSIERNGSPFKQFEYAAENNLVNKYQIGAFIEKYTYDTQQRMLNQTTSYNDEFVINSINEYKENSDEVSNVSYSLGTTLIHKYQYDLDVVNNKNTITTNGDLLKQVTQNNDSNFISSLSYIGKSGTPYNIEYTYTKNGSISTENVNGNLTAFEYNNNNQLTKEMLPNSSVNTYDYDKVGNLTTLVRNSKKTTFSYNAANQISAKNGIPFKFDLDGNLIQDDKYKYTYNQQQRLTKVESLSDSKLVASYTYDENGMRLTKTVGETSYQYFYNDEVLSMEIVKDKNGVKQYRYYEWNAGTPLGMITKTKNSAGTFETKAYQYITNQRGDVLSIRDENDKVVGSYEYDAYGNEVRTEGTLATDNPIRYAGYYYDVETNNYYLQARYYSPENTTFLALDTHPGEDEKPLTQNGYNYANGNPVMNIDPNGELSIRTREVKNVVNAAIGLIPALRPIRIALSNKKTVKLNKELKNGVQKVLKSTTDDALSSLHIKKKNRKIVKAALINSVLALIDLSIGDIVVKILKRFLKTHKKKGKEFYFFGKKGKYEYIKFY